VARYWSAYKPLNNKDTCIGGLPWVAYSRMVRFILASIFSFSFFAYVSFTASDAGTNKLSRLKERDHVVVEIQ
jgi:hypothetical protein